MTNAHSFSNFKTRNQPNQQKGKQNSHLSLAWFDSRPEKDDHQLKKQIAALEAANKQLLSFKKKQEPQLHVSPDVIGKARITSWTIKKMREKLGLSQAEFGKLIDASSQNIHVIGKKRWQIEV